MLFNRSNKLSYQLLIIILSIYFSLTIVMTIIHMYTEYEYTKRNVINELKILEKTYKPALIRSLWELNTAQTEAIAKGIINLPTVTGITIREDSNKLVDLHSDKKEKELIHTFAIEYVGDDIQSVIGEATLYTNNQVIFDRIKVGFYFIVFNALIKSVILIVLFLIVFNRMLTKPLDELSEGLTDIKLNNIENKTIDITVKYDNELTVFKDTFNKMLSTISSDLREKNKLTEKIRKEAFINNYFAETSSSLIATESYEEIFEIILNKSREMTNSLFGFVGYIDEETGYLVCPTLTIDIWEDCKIPNKSFIFEKFTGLWGWVLDNKQALFCNDPKNDPRSSGTPPGHIPIERFMAVPVFIGEQLMGIIALANSEDDYTDKDINNLERMANLYAFSYQKKKLNDKKVEQEEHIARSRNAAMRELLSMIAHQWRQPLQIISMNNNNMQVDIELDNIDSEAFKRHCTSIEEQSIFLRDTIDSFIDLFKQSSEKEKSVNICNIMDSTLEIMGMIFEDDNITIVKKYADIRPTETFPSDLLQIFISVLKNSKDVLIKRDIKDKKIWITIEEDDDKSIDIVVEDNGGGIDSENISQVFEPYYTTKHESIGTGLSLYISKTIVEKNLNGTIKVKNTPNGAEFTISIPI